MNTYSTEYFFGFPQFHYIIGNKTTEIHFSVLKCYLCSFFQDNKMKLGEPKETHNLVCCE